MINYKKLTAAMAAGIIAIFTITGCAMPWQKAADDSSSNVSTASAGNLSQSGENALSLEFDSEDLDSSYNEEVVQLFQEAVLLLKTEILQ